MQKTQVTSRALIAFLRLHGGISSSQLIASYFLEAKSRAELQPPIQACAMERTRRAPQSLLPKSRHAPVRPFQNRAAGEAQARLLSAFAELCAVDLEGVGGAWGLSERQVLSDSCY